MNEPTRYEVLLIDGTVKTGLSYDESMEYFYSHAASVVRPEGSSTSSTKD